MIRTLIIEDEYRSRETLEHLLSRYCPGLELCESASSFETGFRSLLQYKPQLVFLDIELHSPEGTGMELAALPEFRQCGIIFTTGYQSYAADAFRLNAIDYLLKPIRISHLSEAVKKAEAYFQLRKTALPAADARDMLKIPGTAGVMIFRLADIIRLEAEGAYTRIYAKAKADGVICSINIGQIANMLNDSFLRVHKSHIINRNYITEYTRSSGLQVVMSDRKEVPVSRAMRESFFKWLNV